jgi:RNA polymerase sigma factor (sigma-70 family)
MIGPQVREEMVANGSYSDRSTSGAQSGSRVATDEAGLGATHEPAAAIERLWRTHANRLLRTAYGITRHREDAEDALQDAFLRAFVHFDGFDGRASAATWLTRIVINSALMIRRKKNPGRDIPIDPAAEQNHGGEFAWLGDRAASPEEQFAQREREALLRDAVQTLRPSMRRVMELQKLQERSTKETAQMLGLSVPATKTQVHHAKAAIREWLGPKLLGGKRERRELRLPSAA